MPDSTLDQKTEEIAKAIVDSAYKVHKALGPGLLERIYETCLVHELNKKGVKSERQVVIPIMYDGIVFDDGIRLDLLVEDRIIVEIKAVEFVHPVCESQIISYLKLTRLNLGFLINFNVPVIKNGIRRFIIS